MSPKIVIEKVFEERVTEFELPIYLSGYDPLSNQNFKGEFLLKSGKLKPIVCATTKGEQLSNRFITYAVAQVKSFEYEYRKKNKSS